MSGTELVESCFGWITVIHPLSFNPPHCISAETIDIGHLVKQADGLNPIKSDSTDPFKLWIIQVRIILVFTQLLAYPLARLRQPKVIAEVIGGVVLGPTIYPEHHSHS
ncbi:uncharacterized protein EI90DRAFT_3152594 [Cantharellus anzutake]|uniref:uncharacterized protein n=1 Tax=Cantharellus anzutake TaxID=1750568 RepID=UPI0019063C1C|nr:uncharacterized protein EI90DRAFT_3152594 [Cantharellus anzutake]KAF8336425.1 hypothetical protein EI90DRAFT_3152594 [Cantharellus anzutake]